MSHEHSYKAVIQKLPATGEIEIKSSIPAAEFEEAIKGALANIKKEIELPGFRKGAAPEKLVREKIGEAALLQDAAEHAISHAYGHILQAEKIDAIGYPRVNITKMAAGNPLEFTLTTAVVPEIKNLDYKKISAKENAKPVETVAVTDAEIDKTLADIQKNYPDYKKNPEFKDDADFKTKLRENLAQEKQHRALEKKRIELVDALTEKVDVAIPEVLVETELARMSDQMRHDIERMGMKFDDYLKHLGKTADDLKKEWRNDAIKRVKLDLVMAHVAREEKIEADLAKVEAEVKHATEHHKDVDADRAREYFRHIFQNQAVFDFLEKQK